MRFDIKLPKTARLIVVGDIHEHSEQFEKLLDEVKPSVNNRLAFVGDIYDKGFGKGVAEKITDKLGELVALGHAHVICGNHELSSIRRGRKQNDLTDQLKWWERQPFSITFTFTNRSRVTMVHGGVLPSHDWDDLANDIDTCYVRYIDENGNLVKRIKKIVDDRLVMTMAKNGKLWHDLYDGRFGYIASGHNAQKDGIPKFYKYSCNLDTAVYNTGKLTAQVFEDGLRKELLTIEGTPKYPNLEDMERLMKKGRL